MAHPIRLTGTQGVPLLFGTVLSVCALGGTASGSGFAVTTQGATGTARSSAFSAQADDPSAVYYNPAGIVQLSAPSFLTGVTVIRPHAEFYPDETGNPAEERARYYVLPHAYVTVPAGDEIRVGLGFFSPFGLATKWPSTWDGRFQVIDAKIKVVLVNPVVAWRIHSRVSAAAGVQYANVMLSERRAVNLASFVPDAPEGSMALTGTAVAHGFNLGLLVTPSPYWQVGASFRSRMNAEIQQGTADFGVAAPFVATFPDGSIRTELTLPPSLRGGVLLRLLSGVVVEFDAMWTGWSTIDTLDIEFATGLPVAVDRMILGWHDTVSYALGLEYLVSQMVRARAGALYDPSPIPEERATPLIPDADRRGLTAGIGIRSKRWSVDVGYEFLTFERQKYNAVGSQFDSTSPPVDARANGLYRSHAHVGTLSVGGSF